MRIWSIHERTIPADPSDAAALLDTLSSAQDRLWPTDRWPAQRFDGPLGVGVVGGHGPIRYAVEAYEPGRHVAYRMTSPFRGRHWIDVVPTEQGIQLRHVISASAGWVNAVWWVVAIRWLHDALIEDAFDNAERELTGEVRDPARWSWWVRALRLSLR
ncbi:MAG: SRPBCC family protein [Myxococcota bacterium]